MLPQLRDLRRQRCPRSRDPLRSCCKSDCDHGTPDATLPSSHLISRSEESHAPLTGLAGCLQRRSLPASSPRRCHSGVVCTKAPAYSYAPTCRDRCRRTFVPCCCSLIRRGRVGSRQALREQRNDGDGGGRLARLTTECRGVHTRRSDSFWEDLGARFRRATLRWRLLRWRPHRTRADADASGEIRGLSRPARSLTSASSGKGSDRLRSAAMATSICPSYAGANQLTHLGVQHRRNARGRPPGRPRRSA